MHFLSRDKNFYKQFFSMLFFIAGQNLIVFSVNLADNVMLGNFSENALAGVALANQVQFLLQMVFVGMLVGMTMVVTTGNVIVMHMHMGISFGHFFFIIIAAGFGVKTFIFPRIRGAGLLSPGKWDIMR